MHSVSPSLVTQHPNAKILTCDNVHDLTVFTGCHFPVLTHLTARKLSPYICNFLLGTIFPNLTHLRTETSASPGWLPSTLTHLVLGDTFNEDVSDLPQSLISLKFGRKFDMPVDKLPPCLKKVRFGYKFRQPVENLPSSLTHLKFGYKYDDYDSLFTREIERFPPNLTHLQFGYYFSHEVDHLLPQSLIHLCFGQRYNVAVDNLPLSLKYIKFGQMFN